MMLPLSSLNGPVERIIWLFLLFMAVFCAGVLPAAQPVFQVLRNSQEVSNLLFNGGFERLLGNRAASWSGYEAGYETAPGQGRSNSTAIVCQNLKSSDKRGAVQAVTLNQTEPLPILVRGFSKAENVSGSPDSDYSLYVDLVYQDGTPLWGQVAPFRCGTHDWEIREVVILPEKPVKRLSVYGLFRGHSGRVWFDDFTLGELRATGGASLFQGAKVLFPTPPPSPAHSPRPTSRVSHDLTLELHEQQPASLIRQGNRLTCPGPAGFYARDVQAGSDFFGFESGVCKELNLRLETQITTLSNRPGLGHFLISGKLTDLTGKDRAITLVFGLPVAAQGWQWGDDIRRARPIKDAGDYSKTVSVRCGATGTMSLYPLASIWNDRHGLTLAIDMGKPAIYRAGYHAGLSQLYLAYDFALAPDTLRFPSVAEFQFVLYTFDPQWGFRAAFDTYTRLFQDYFLVRSKDQGIWMPFTDVSTVQGWQDFGFKYHEGNNNVPFDDANGILSFRYTEPMTWWMSMPKDAPRTLESALRIRDDLAAAGKPGQRLPALVTRTAAMHDESGQPHLLFRNEPWCNGAVWSLNPNPHLPGSNNFASWHWTEEIKQKLYGPAAKGSLDGEYLDSLEGYVTADLNFRRDHFASTTVPLAFATDTHRPALYKGLAVFEFTKWICEDVHRLGKLTFANGVPYRFTFLCPWLDVMGTETDWNRGGQYQPPSDSTLSLWRTLAGAKPYLLLMNTRYDAFTPDRVEKYFQHCAFYGFYPSMFSHNASENPYWQNPVWYNRDRPLFKKYIPVIKRVAEAGWQPITLARSNNPDLWIERFGPADGPVFFLTAFNGTAQPQLARLSLSPSVAPAGRKIRVTELLSGHLQSSPSNAWDLRLAPQHVAVFEIKSE